MKVLSTSITRSFILMFILLGILGALGAAAASTNPAGDHSRDRNGSVAAAAPILPTDPSPPSTPHTPADNNVTVQTSSVDANVIGPQATTAVNTTSDTDDGACAVAHCSLREAINASNTSRDYETITFNIPVATDAGCSAVTGVCTIRPTSPLPTISDSVIIDGYTQPGATPNTNPTGAINAVLKIELDGSISGEFTGGLYISAGRSTVRGLVISRFHSTSGYGGIGIYLATQAGTQIVGNFIGTDVAGLTDLGNGGAGVVIGSAADQFLSGNWLGGTTPDARNLISGNGFGVSIQPTDFYDPKANIV